MHLCYIDESGTPDVPGNTSHYVLAGLYVADEDWKSHHVQTACGLYKWVTRSVPRYQTPRW